MKKEKKSAYLALSVLVAVLVILLAVVGPYYLGKITEDLNASAPVENISEPAVVPEEPAPEAPAASEEPAAQESPADEPAPEAPAAPEEPVPEKGGDMGIASLPGDISSCQVIDYTPGIYTLDRNITDVVGNCFNVTVSNVVINCQGNNLTGDGTGSAIYLMSGTTNVTVRNCVLDSFDSGIRLENSSGNTLSDNDFYNSNYGIYLWNSTDNIIDDNYLESNALYGVFLNGGSAHNTVMDNTVRDHDYGIFASQSGSNSILSNNINITSFYAIFSNNSAGNVITSNVLSECGNGISAENSPYTSMNFNRIPTNCGSTGFKVLYSNYSNITSGVNYYRSEIEVLNSSYVNVYNNTINWPSDDAILAQYSPYCNVTGNRVYDAEGDIRILRSDYSVVAGNYMSAYDRSSNGISISLTNHSTIRDNGVVGNFDSGIYVSSSVNNTIFSNSVNYSYYYGLYLADSYSNNVSSNVLNRGGKYDIYATASTDAGCNNIVLGNNGSGGSIYYYNSSINSAGLNASEVLLCNADGSNFTRINITGVGNNGLLLVRMNYSNVYNSSIKSSYRGLALESSSNNNLSVITIDNATCAGLYQTSSSANKFENVSISRTSEDCNLVGDYGYDIQMSTTNRTQIVNSKFRRYNFEGAGNYLVSFEDTQYGKIAYLGLLSAYGSNLSADLAIGYNYVYVNATSPSGGNSGLNKSANISLYNLPTTFARPAILRDGLVCPSSTCYNFTSLNAGIVVRFNVTGWSNYSIAEGYQVTGGCGALNAPNTIYKLSGSVHSTSTCFNITADNVTIDCINWANRIIYGNSTDHSTSYGIYSNATRTTVKNCDITMGNLADGTLERYAIYYYESSNGTVDNVNASNNRQGIVMEGTSSQNNITNNIASNNAQTGIYLITNIGNQITGNTVNNNKFGIRLYWQSDHNLVSNNTANGNSYAGLYFGPSADNNTIRFNYADNNVYGFMIEDGDNNKVYSNELNGNGHGIFLYNHSEYNNVTNNLVRGSSYSGVWIDFLSNYNNFSLNRISNGAADGIFINGSSSGNILTKNNITNNSNFGIEIVSASGNLIYDNIFNNTKNAKDAGANNWNITKTSGVNVIGRPYIGGNFWSDYYGNDTTGDYLGDTNLPYNASNFIGGGYGDWLPIADNLCGKTIYPNLTLNSNLNCEGTALTVGANNVTIDCNGYNITGNGTGYGIYIYDKQNVTIRNCTISQFERGISAELLRGDSFIEYNTIYNNTRGISMEGCNYTSIRYNHVFNHTNNGIFLLNSGNYNVVLGNIVQNSRYGIVLGSGVNHNLVQNNSISYNSIHGFEISSINNTLVGNEVYGNTMDGIQIYGVNNTIRDNRIYNNSARGIMIDSANSNLVFGNFIANNSGYNIALRSSSDNIVHSNRVFGTSRSIHMGDFGMAANNNLVYNNYFAASNAVDANGVNYWNSTLNCSAGPSILGGPCIGGNYWIGYAGYDLTGDKIGDEFIPYNTGIATGGDYLPLAGDLCGKTLTRNLTLITNLNCNGSALTVGADNITIDCNGYSITGNGSGNAISALTMNNITVKNCTISSFDRGIYFSGFTQLSKIIYNRITNTASDGIYFDFFVSNNTIENNSISWNIGNAINFFDNSNYNDIRSNTIKDNGGYGIFLDNNIKYGTISGNNITNNSHGIYIYLTSNSNLIYNNYIMGNRIYGLFSADGVGSDSDYNLIYNNFFDNIRNANDAGGTNYWNTTSSSGTNIIGGPNIGGNFWSDYYGNDSNGDGFGNYILPYNASGNISIGGDWLPLTEVNTAPVIEALQVNSSSGMNVTTDYIQCWVNASDVDAGDTLYYYVTWYKNGLVNRTLENGYYSSGELVLLDNFAPANTLKGDNISCEVRAYDQLAYSDYNITENLTILNSVPYFNPNLANQTVDENSTLSYDINCSDADDDTLNYYLNDSSQFTLSVTSGEMSWTPAIGQAGNYSYRVECADAEVNASQEFMIFVRNISAVCGNSVCESGEDCSSCSADCGACSTSSGGGGGGGHHFETFSPTDAQLFNGFHQSHQVEDRTMFLFNGKQHYVIVDRMYDGNVVITVMSLPVTFTLKVGETKRIDIDDNGIYDLLIRVDGLRTSPTSADIGIWRITESVYPAPTPEPTPQPEPTPEPAPEEIPPVQETGKGISSAVMSIIIVLIILIVGILAGLLVVSARREKELVETGRRWVEDAKMKGYSHKQINQMLHERAWARKEIKKVMEKK